MLIGEGVCICEDVCVCVCVWSAEDVCMQHAIRV